MSYLIDKLQQCKDNNYAVVINNIATHLDNSYVGRLFKLESNSFRAD